MLRTPQNSRAMPSIRLVISVGTAGLLGLSGYCYLKGSPIFFERVIMPAVSRMDPERAHHAAVWLASMGIVPRDNSKDPTGLVRILNCMISICSYKVASLSTSPPIKSEMAYSTGDEKLRGARTKFSHAFNCKF